MGRARKAKVHFLLVPLSRTIKSAWHHSRSFLQRPRSDWYTLRAPSSRNAESSYENNTSPNHALRTTCDREHKGGGGRSTPARTRKARVPSPERETDLAASVQGPHAHSATPSRPLTSLGMPRCTTTFPESLEEKSRRTSSFPTNSAPQLKQVRDAVFITSAEY